MTTLLNKSDSGPPLRQIRFVHNQGQPPSKRRRINAACLTCRRRKTRCAGERPICSTCTKNGHQCLGYPEDARKDGTDTGESKHVDDEDLNEEHQSDDDDRKALKPDAPSASSAPDAAPAISPPRTIAVAPRSAPARPGAVVEPEHDVDVKPVVSPSSHHQSHPSAATDDMPSSPTLRRNHNNRIPYFRYFGPTAIVPGFKQMVVSVRDRRRSTGGSQSGTSPMSTPSGVRGSSCAAGSDIAVEDLPAYDPNSPGPVHPLIINLVKTFFVHLGCNYPFLKQPKFLRLVIEKRVEPILVDAICALAARVFRCPAADRRQRKDAADGARPGIRHARKACYRGHVPVPDSALWMYLGLAIRMAIDLGLQKRVGIQYQGEKDPWYTRHRSRVNGESESPEEKKHDEVDALTVEEQREVEQERIDTFWAVFILDRVISSGTGRTVTFREDDFELPFPKPAIDPATGWPSLFPVFLEIIHLYGRVSDVLNNIHNVKDLDQDKWTKLSKMEHQLTRLYKNWDARLQFNVGNFKAYLSVGQGTTFLLLHFWFHALFIILHQPTLLTPFGDLRGELQLLSDSRELSMSSAKTICDILAFADLIDPKSFIGNPFTSQPIYIAACAFLMESSANASEGPSREASPPASNNAGRHRERVKPANSKPSRHSLLASAANQNYQRCYNSLQQLHTHWGGVKYILTALDQKSKGIWDCETYTSEEYESTKAPPTRGSISGELATASPKMGGAPPIAWSLAGTANSPNSNLTLLYQNLSSGVMTPSSAPRACRSRQGHHRATWCMTLSGRACQQKLAACIRLPFPRPPHRRSVTRHRQGTASPDGRLTCLECQSLGSQHSGGFEAFSASPVSNLADAANRSMAHAAAPHNVYYNHHMPYQTGWGYGMGNMDSITFDSQDIDIGALGLQQPELMSGWLDYIPSDVLGLFENQNMGQGEPRRHRRTLMMGLRRLVLEGANEGPGEGVCFRHLDGTAFPM
ncbi:hypothetical protein ACCO45_004743 [Purpureocillium lilacinum]|uniref:Uncharacterized protein n=1 Tax=Purpureocillium lilacinum TaxID=33203 RepID=A0ACC4DTE8_PURLI